MEDLEGQAPVNPPRCHIKSASVSTWLTSSQVSFQSSVELNDEPQAHTEHVDDSGEGFELHKVRWCEELHPYNTDTAATIQFE